MSPAGVRLLRIGAVLVPVLGILLLLNLLTPTLETWVWERNLPEGYERIEDFESATWLLYARPDEKRARYAGTILDAFTSAVYEEYRDVFRLVRPDLRFGVIVFSSREDIVAYAQRELDNDFRWSGGFYEPERRVVAVTAVGETHRFVRALFHEGTHLMMNAWTGGGGHAWSRWLEEGFATYFEASEPTGDGIRLGGADPSRVQAMRDALERGEWLPVARILRATPAEFTGPDNARFYGAAALLVHFLVEGEGGAYRDRFFRYVRLERRPGPVAPDAFRGIVGSPSEIDEGLRRHLFTLP